jgi:hypothetical protein
MRFYTRQHKFYCGVDLHARSMYVCVLDQEGNVLVSRNIASAPEPFLELIAPYREDVAVAAECMFTWYWLADVCARERLVFVSAGILKSPEWETNFPHPSLLKENGRWTGSRNLMRLM